MNQQMWSNAATQANVATAAAVAACACSVPAVGDQACGETGPGRMLEPTEIVVADRAAARRRPDRLRGRRVLVTAGPTRECIDPVRFVSNRSSGKMGFARGTGAARGRRRGRADQRPGVAADAARAYGAWTSRAAEQMHAAVQRELPGTAIFVGTAAVADYRPRRMRRRRRSRRPARSSALEMTRTTDILAQVSASSAAPVRGGLRGRDRCGRAACARQAAGARTWT